MEIDTDQQPRLRKVGPAEEVAGLVLAVAGAVTLLVGLVRRSRLLRVLGLLLALAGGGFFARNRYVERAGKIDAAEDTIRSELADLDPVARAQVLADVTKEQF